jgi:hypothetical protein
MNVSARKLKYNTKRRDFAFTELPNRVGGKTKRNHEILRRYY